GVPWAAAEPFPVEPDVPPPKTAAPTATAASIAAAAPAAAIRLCRAGEADAPPGWPPAASAPPSPPPWAARPPGSSTAASDPGSSTAASELPLYSTSSLIGTAPFSALAAPGNARYDRPFQSIRPPAGHCINGLRRSLPDRSDGVRAI